MEDRPKYDPLNMATNFLGQIATQPNQNPSQLVGQMMKTVCLQTAMLEEQKAEVLQLLQDVKDGKVDIKRIMVTDDGYELMPEKPSEIKKAAEKVVAKATPEADKVVARAEGIKAATA